MHTVVGWGYLHQSGRKHGENAQLHFNAQMQASDGMTGRTRMYRSKSRLPVGETRTVCRELLRRWSDRFETCDWKRMSYYMFTPATTRNKPQVMNKPK
jgi:hypothetical protein